MIKPKEITRIRKALGMTREEFAVALCVSYRTVERWERSKDGKNTPHAASVQRILELAKKEK